jgi:hypothetical protein
MHYSRRLKYHVFFMLKIYECMKDEDDVNGISITNVKSSDTIYTRML